ncbi:hypothetical protein F0U61_44475 [Archangium violaceum]|uniref:DUF6069 family protein n=1 Tax=Archangium violaceum TaxID=83451 RepID=UPI002B2B6B08|nr:hypothetical protein F0U61_44475 [Archangium violaceum]
MIQQSQSLLAGMNALARARTRLLLVLSAITFVLAQWYVVVALLGIQITVPVSPGAAEREDLLFRPVLFASLIAGFGAWGLLEVLERLSPRGLRIWTGISIAVFVLTLPYMPGFSLGERLFLLVEHGGMFSIIVLGMRRTCLRA